MYTIPNDAILVTAEVVQVWPSIPHESRLKAIKETLDKRKKKRISAENLLLKLTFVLKNNHFEFNGQVKQQSSWIAIGCIFMENKPYVCILTENIETGFLMTQKYQPLVWHQHIDVIFFIWSHIELDWSNFLKNLTTTIPNLNWATNSHVFLTESFLNIYMWNLLTVINISIMPHRTTNILID